METGPSLYQPPPEYPAYVSGHDSDHDAERFLSRFLSTRRYRFLRNRFEELIHQDDLDVQKTRDNFAGALFQSIAYDRLKRETASPRVLYSPGKTAALLHELYPGISLTRDLFGIPALEGITAIDGIITKTDEDTIEPAERITTLCEYTLSSDPEAHEKKYDGFTFLKRIHPTVFSDTNFLYVLPYQKHKPAIAYCYNVETVHIPITTLEFRAFTDRIFCDVTGGRI